MKKLIFLLLLAQTISFLYADSACMGYRKYQGSDGTLSDPADKNAWRWGVKSMYKIRCDCPCMQYKQLANHKCIMCGHTRVPKDLRLSGMPEADQSASVITVKTVKHKQSSYDKSSADKQERKALKEKNKEERRRKKVAAKKKADHTKNTHKKLIAVTDE